MEKEGQTGEGANKAKKDDQSWVGDNKGSVNKVSQEDSTFGGWASFSDIF